MATTADVCTEVRCSASLRVPELCYADRPFFAPHPTVLLEIKHAIAAGRTGTGRSVHLSPWQQKDAPESIQPIFINFSVNFSAQTHVNQLQNLFDSKFEKKHRGVHGSPAGKKTVIFIDDLNMSKIRLALA